MNDRQSKQRLLYLDSARGLAAISVITFHFLFAVFGSQLKSQYSTVSHFFWYGEADVIFFFIHSGFILAYSYAGKDAKLTPKYYLRFLLERIFRIYPLFLVVLLLSFIAINNSPANLYTNEPYVGLFWNYQPGWNDFFRESLLIVRLPESANLRLIPQDWTLTIELLAGAAVPLLAFSGKRNLFLFILLLAVLKTGNFFSTYIFEFGLGVLLFLIRDNIINAWLKCNMLIRILFATAALLLYSCFFIFPSFFAGDVVFIDSRIDRFIVAIGCMLLFILLLSSAKVQRLLSLPFLVVIGKICYSVYLLHQLLIFIFWRQFPSFFQGLPKGNPALIVLVYLAYIAIVILLSRLFFKLIEQPMNRIGKRIARSIKL
jgi:peptidoglycan/LPS O-acetylase OafA/YrhL